MLSSIRTTDSKFDGYLNPDKEKAREAICQWTGAPAKGVLLLPGAWLLDLGLLDLHGAIGSSTNIYLFERDEETRRNIVEQIPVLELPSTKISLISAELEDVDPYSVFGNNRIDFAFADFCGTLTARKWLWLNKFGQRLRVGDVFAATFTKLQVKHNDYSKITSKLPTLMANPFLLRNADMVKQCSDKSRQMLSAVAFGLTRDLRVESVHEYQTGKTGGLNMLAFRMRVTSTNIATGSPTFMTMRKRCERLAFAKASKQPKYVVAEQMIPTCY